jgi:energy-coupling factor transporter ATP-binding protein EcfA2
VLLVSRARSPAASPRPTCRLILPAAVQYTLATGLWGMLCARPEVRVLLAGPTGSGKTTVAELLKRGLYRSTAHTALASVVSPTIGMNLVQARVCGADLTVLDVGGMVRTCTRCGCCCRLQQRQQRRRQMRRQELMAQQQGTRGTRTHPPSARARSLPLSVLADARAVAEVPRRQLRRGRLRF